MAIFDRLAFLEGEQAEVYKARKAKEEEDRKKAEEERIERRYKSMPGTKHSYQYLKANNLNYQSDEDCKSFTAHMRKEIDRGRNAKNRVVDDDNKHPERDYKLGKKFGYSKEDIDKARKIINSDEISPEDDKWMGDQFGNQRGEDFNNKKTRSMNYALDAQIKHMKRHPEKYRESTVFESVRFLNE